MKKTLLFLAAMISTLFHAQSELYNTDWYLKKVVKSNVAYLLPQNSEIGTPVLTFTANPGNNPPTTNMSSPICGTSIWGLLYDSEITANNLSFWTNGIGYNQTCTMPENINFFTKYTDYFASHPSPHQYQITTSGNTKSLILTNYYGDQAFYESSFLNSKETTVLPGSKTIKIYPNPVKDGYVYIKNTDRIEGIKMYSSEGKLIRHYSSDSKIDVSGLPKGGYFLEIKFHNGISRHTLIKE